MLLFDPIYDTIIEILTSEKNLPTQNLYKKIVQKSPPISLPNFYKIVSRLVSDQILIKENGQISIHRRWILGISELAEKLRESHLKIDSDISELKE